LYHADIAEREGVGQRKFLHDFPLENWVDHINFVEFPFDNDREFGYPQDVSLLYVLAHRNAANLIKIHPSNLKYHEVEKGRFGTPLFAALVAGSEEVVCTFIDLDIETEPPQSWLRNLPRHFHHDSRTKDVFKEPFMFRQRTILSRLAQLGHDVMFALALKKEGMEINARDHDGRSALTYAAMGGFDVIAKLLVETHIVDVDAKDDRGRTPLLYAASFGHTSVIKLLLTTRKVDVDVRDKYGQTPIYHAAYSGRTAALGLLLRTEEVDVNIKDVQGNTPLFYAAFNRHAAVVKLLLEVGKADMNLGQQPLYGLGGMNEEIVSLLHQYRAVEMDNMGRIELSYAAEKCETTMVDHWLYA
jgi:ankyrin repeat protein